MAARMALRNLQPKFLHFSRLPCCLCSRNKQTSAEQVASGAGNIDHRTLFVNNFPASYKEEQFRELCSDLWDVKIKTSHFRAKEPFRCAFLEFESEEKAEKNLQVLKEQRVEGVSLYVDYAKNLKAKENTDKKILFVKNFPESCKEEQFQELCTDIKDVRIKDLHQPFNYAYLEFLNEELAAKNFELLKGKQIEGAKLYVDYATGPKPVDINRLQLHVTGLERSKSCEELEAELRNMYPEATEVILPTLKKGVVAQKSIGYGFINFQTEKECQEAFERTKGKYGPICVLPSTSKQAGLKEIVIPKRKRRDATSILKALSSTVGHDPLAANYTFVDDPALQPPYHELQRIYALSKAAGRRTARYMVNEFYEAFTHDDAAPHIKAYDPDVTEYEHTEATEEALIERIDLRRVTHAVEVYKKMQKLGLVVSPTVLQSFLELLCVYNHEDPQSLYPEERMYLRPKDIDGVSTWQGNCLAEQIFEDLPEKTAEAYNALIRGMFMHKNEARAFKLYEEMKEKHLPVYKETYIQMLEGAAHVYNLHKGRLEDFPDKGQRYWDLVLSLLKEMKENKIAPCLATFNAVLKSMINARVILKLDRLDAVLNEMHQLGIEPSLESWGHVLNTVGAASGGRRIPQVTSCIESILKELKKKPIEVNRFEDIQFFLVAMTKIYQSTNRTDLAIELNELRESLGSAIPSGRAQDDFIYYKSFLNMLIQTEPVETVMREYSKIVPYVYVPDVDMFCAIVDNLKLHSALQYLPQIWEDVFVTSYKYFSKFAVHMFAVLAEKKYEAELQTEFIKMADQMFIRWTESLELMKETQRSGSQIQRNGNMINGEIIGYLIEIALYSDDLDKAWAIFSAYRDHVEEFDDRPVDRSYKALFEASFKSRDPEKIMGVVNMMNEQSIPNLYSLIDQAKTELDIILDDTQRSVVDSL